MSCALATPTVAIRAALADSAKRIRFMVLLLSLIRALLDKNLRRLLFRPQSLSTTIPMQFRAEQIFKGTSSEFDNRRGRVARRRRTGRNATRFRRHSGVVTTVSTEACAPGAVQTGVDVAAGASDFRPFLGTAAEKPNSYPRQHHNVKQMWRYAHLRLCALCAVRQQAAKRSHFHAAIAYGGRPVGGRPSCRGEP
jgi:hypothetical protein